MRYLVATLTLLALASCAANDSRDQAEVQLECRAGLYRNDAGELLALTPLTSGGYRWRTLDGRTSALKHDGSAWRSLRGWTNELDGLAADLSACSDGELRLGQPDALTTYRYTPIETTDTTFERDGVTLAGRLLTPNGAEPAPLVVFVHGSGSYSALQHESYPWLLAAEGINVFVYDKRGTGASGGEYTQDFDVLSADARAALTQARQLAGARASTAGFMGASQGGWVAPLAASRADVDFTVVLYGLAESPLAENRNEVVQGMARAGWGQEEQAKAAALADASGEIIASNFREGFGEFDRLRREYRNEPWYDDVEGEFTGEMLPYPSIALRLVGPSRNRGTSWRYEPVPVLRALETPQFWVIAADDTEAPPAETIARIRALQAEGRPIDLAIYPDSDHGMILQERNGDDVREIGHVRDYFRQIAAWIKARDLSYARAAGAEVTPATSAVP